MAESKVKIDPLGKPGFHLLKAGKSIAGTRYKRGNDIGIIKKGKKETLKNISKKSYVSNSQIKNLNINLAHFESKTFESIPATD